MTTGSDKYFLDVDRSARGMAWRDRLSDAARNTALQIAQETGLPDILARVLAGRGVAAEHAERFLNPTLRELMPDPQSFTAMDLAAKRIADAIIAGEKVAILGDYDVDGAASSALFFRYLGYFGIEPEIYIPDRVFEGYGPNDEAMRGLAERGASLIITVDCGTNSAGPIEAGVKAGADVVVLDHHQVGGELPECAAVVNPNREDDLSGQGHLCAAGVCFITLVAVNAELRQRGTSHKLPDLLSGLDLVALATVCDVVPLIGVNRAFVVKGLAVAKARSNAGLAALADVARIGEPLAPFHLGFALGPRINAGGRIGNAALGARLLCLDDPIEAQVIAAELDRLNAERQAMEQEMLEQAFNELDAEFAQGEGPSVIVTANEKWHPGIVGLIAARLKEKSHRPAFAIAFDVNGRGTGSGRSVSGVDLGRLVRGAVENGIAEKGGGHAMAAGITVVKDRLGDLRAFLEEKASEDVARAIAGRSLKIDAALSADGATTELIELLESAGPFGTSHPQPVIVLPRHLLASVREVGRDHLKVALRSQTGRTLDAIAFRSVGTELGDLLSRSSGSDVHVAGTLSINHWNGRRIPQLRIIDAALPV